MNEQRDSALIWIAMSTIFIAVMLFFATIVLVQMLEKMP